MLKDNLLAILRFGKLLLHIFKGQTRLTSPPPSPPRYTYNKNLGTLMKLPVNWGPQWDPLLLPLHDEYAAFITNPDWRTSTSEQGGLRSIAIFATVATPMAI